MLINLLKRIYSKTGNHKYSIDQKLFENFFDNISIYDCGYELIRIGNSNDGGYLIPNILGKINLCFSAGVGDNFTFEQDLTRRGIKCFFADGTVKPNNEIDILIKT